MTMSSKAYLHYDEETLLKSLGLNFAFVAK